MPVRSRSVLFQAMGRGAKEEEWTKITWPDAQRVSADGGRPDTRREKSKVSGGTPTSEVFSE